MSTMPITISEELYQLQAEASLQAKKIDAEISQLRAELEAQQEDARGKYQMVLEEIQSAFRESEEYFEKWKKAESLIQPLCLECKKIDRAHQRNTGTHRSWDFILHEVNLFGRHWAQLDVRLVEHEGNAGILIFESRSPSQAFHRWDPNGEEGGRNFMLFVPHDRSTKNLLSCIPAGDFVFLRDAVSKILQEIIAQEKFTSYDISWLQVARRLLEHFNKIPNRIYYDAVETSILPEQNGKHVLLFNLVNAYYAGNVYKSLPIVWETSASQSKVRIGLSAENAWPLVAWPFTESGHPEKEVVFDLGSASAESTARKKWSKWLKHDQQLVFFLIKELPNFIYHLSEQHSESSIPKASFQKQARKMYRKLKRIAAGKRARTFQRFFQH